MALHVIKTPFAYPIFQFTWCLFQVSVALIFFTPPGWEEIIASMGELSADAVIRLLTLEG